MLAAAPKIPISKLSSMAAILFMAAFLLVNAITFMEGAKRLAIIDKLNQANIPQMIIAIDQALWRIDIITDHQELANNRAEFARAISDLKEKLSDLEVNSAPKNERDAAAPHFSEIDRIIRKEQALYAHRFPSMKSRKDAFEPLMQDINFHFNQIGLWALERHQHDFSIAMDHLRAREKFLHILGLAFVTLGCFAVIFLVLDLSRRDELLMNARHAERMKSSFFAMMSHEIRTPINGVLGMLTLLMESALSKQQAQMAKIAKNSAEGLLHIVNDVLDYSKIEAGKLELEFADFSLRELVGGAIDLMEPLARGKGLSLSYHISADLPDAIRADATRVRQILFNFLSNAVKFTENGGITLQIMPEPAASDGTPASIRFSVTDTGIGISAEERTLLFREFSQVEGSLNRRFSGTGLGLAICARLTEMMKGSIGVSSEKSKGSTFWFSMPLLEAELSPKPAPQPKVSTARMRPANILLVEDNLTNQVIAATFLRNAGHTVDIAENGLQALSMVRDRAYDLVFMDVSMPVMDGLNATKAIRAQDGRCRQVPILAMTAHAMRSDREQCLKAGMNGYLAKPATREMLLEAVQRWAATPVDPILSCVESLNNPDLNPDGSPVLKPHDLPCPDEDAGTSGNAPEVNDEAFNQLFRDLGRAGFIQYEKVFKADITKTSQEMTVAAEKGNWAGVRLHAHSIKSSVLNFGLVKLSNLAEQIETQCISFGKAEAGLIRRFPDAWNNAVSAFNARITALGLPPL